jgi:hypothetical protein
VFFIFPIHVSAQNTLDFVGESIDFEIDGQEFAVNGIYYFVNRSPSALNQAMLFPFPESADSVVVDRVYNLTYSRNVPYRTANNAITFKLIALPGDTVMVNIGYSQRTLKENMYILESTRTWKKALQYAEYSLVTGKSIRVDSFSIAPDTLLDNVYRWTKKDFYPGENFIVWIE